ncbi:agglutinin biogenesis protein MshI [Accumulibacter sp.]|uniref:agglutinin biogenesis protein MshI n=1 Tax=Accumulibacter sp. TaxID=2053492 RepID=UPI0028C4307E|nr:agglutinin biogenesis protein MshI [Accumulibacter sp.]
MRIFGSTKRDGWLAVASRKGVVDLTHIHVGAGGRPEVTLYESFRTEGGEVDTYSRLCKQLGLDHYHSTTSLRFGEYQFLQVDPPDVPAQEMKEAMRWHIKGMVDFPVEHATLDILEVSAEEGGSTRSRIVFVACAPNQLLAARIQTLQKARIDIEAIDVPETAQRNLSVLYEPPGRGIAMLGFSDEGGLLTFTCAGELQAFRRLEITLEQLLRAGAEERQTLFDRIVLETQRSLDTFGHQRSYINLAQLMVMPLPEEVGLATYLAQNLYVSVEATDLGKVMDLIKVPELRATSRQAQCFYLLGAALRGFEVRA